jgi:hypothetical protein
VTRVGWALRARACRCAAAPVEQGSASATALGEKTKKAPQGGLFCFLAERVAIFSHPRISEKVQNSFEVLHLAESLR